MDKIFVIDRAAFNQGANAQYPPHIEEAQVMDTLVARGPHAVSYAPATVKMSSALCAQGTGRASETSTSTRERSW